MEIFKKYDGTFENKQINYEIFSCVWEDTQGQKDKKKICFIDWLSQEVNVSFVKRVAITYLCER